MQHKDWILLFAGAALSLLVAAVVKYLVPAWSERSRKKVRCSAQWVELCTVNDTQISRLASDFVGESCRFPSFVGVRPMVVDLKIQNPEDNVICEVEIHVNRCIIFLDPNDKTLKKGGNELVIKSSIHPSKNISFFVVIDCFIAGAWDSIQIYEGGKKVPITELRFRHLSERGWYWLHIFANNWNWLLFLVAVIVNILLYQRLINT